MIKTKDRWEDNIKIDVKDTLIRIYKMYLIISKINYRLLQICRGERVNGFQKREILY